MTRALHITQTYAAQAEAYTLETWRLTLEMTEKALAEELRIIRESLALVRAEQAYRAKVEQGIVERLDGKPRPDEGVVHFHGKGIETACTVVHKELDPKPFLSDKGVRYEWGGLYFGAGRLQFAPGNDYNQDFEAYREANPNE